LVDTPPEFRLQAIRAGLRRLDAILFTHSHADHIFGLDDVRRFQGETLPCYASESTLKDLRRVFRYAFVPGQRGGGKPRLELRPLNGSLDLFGLHVRPLTVLHGEYPVTAFRFGRAAYVTDVSHVPDDAMAALEGLDLLILDALRYRPHSTHFNIEQALNLIQRLKPRRALLTHLCHDVDHARTSAELPEAVGLAYDGLVVEVGVGESGTDPRR
jgi:phosphoribosyl 1,2-cyclic phosphate phosphodiesterase